MSIPVINKFVPYLTTAAGACLTQANWDELGIEYGLCELMHLITKPGLEFWKNGMSLARYLVWEKKLILDASRLVLNARSQFVVQSPYDGKRHVFNLDEFWDLVQQLKPDSVLLPPGITKRPSDSIHLYSPGSKLEDDVYRVSTAGLFLLDGKQVLYASDQPALDAVQGVVYRADSTSYSILDAAHAMDFRCLGENCACPTCQQSFTQAYLHYLLQSTPLLAQRFLLMHNIFNLSLY